MRDSAENLSRSDAKRCRENLLKYYHDMVRVSIPHCMLTRQLSQVKILICIYLFGICTTTQAQDLAPDVRRLNLESFAQVVFILPVETVLIESLFSVIELQQGQDEVELEG